jgi:uncharacterized protein YbbC (DUF1343 family)
LSRVAQSHSPASRDDGEIRRQHPNDFAWGRSIDRLTGSDKVRLAIEAGTLPSLLEEWDREAAEFAESRKPFLLYP